MVELKQKLNHLCTKLGYTFIITRSQRQSLDIQFTAIDSVIASEATIRKELSILAQLFQRSLESVGITLKPAEFKAEWKNWKLKIEDIQVLP